LLCIGSTVEGLLTGQQTLRVKATVLLVLHQNILSHLTDLPNSMAAIVKAAQVAQAEVLARAVIVMERITSAKSEHDQLRAKVDEIRAV
jgi:ABC-type histidine transport system ATPase subunit